MVKADKARDWLFRQVHRKNLVYNTCWEDPRCDRKLLNLDSRSEVVMITSAGCNALDYLLDHPAHIYCVDLNPRQNALLQLKLSVFNNASFGDLFHLFGKGNHPQAAELYREQLRQGLSAFAREFWDSRLRYFSNNGVRKTFYHYGTAGAFAWMASRYLKANRPLYRQVEQLFEAGCLGRQADIYYQIERRILNPLVEWAVNRHLTMCLLGVPRSQQQLFVTRYNEGALGFIRECFRKVFTQLPLHDNYFWWLYFKGTYSENCCPSYLERRNFDTIREVSGRAGIYTGTISNFLKENPGHYSHFVLLDHQDWLAANDLPALEEEWRLILENSRPGARILLRSAAKEVDFFPGFVKEAVVFEKENTALVHREDRVGTYASVYLGIVK
ncbi:MAG: BtaA family protein [Lewinellaceae bacterium]|nr:BtaA family protein [Lewinellaceae bacterium]